MRFGDAAELRFPVAVEHDPVDVVLGRRTARVPAIRARCVETDVPRGAGVVIRIEQGLDGTFTEKLPGDCRGDAVAGHVGQLLSGKSLVVSLGVAILEANVLTLDIPEIIESPSKRVEGWPGFDRQDTDRD